jgi:uncharacterized protein (TIGR02145 family)
MKTIFLFAMLLIVSVFSFSQKGVGTSALVPSVVSNIINPSNELAPLRISTAQKNAISSPTAGLQVWCIDCGTSGGELQLFNGIAWTRCTPVEDNLKRSNAICDGSVPTTVVEITSVTGKIWMDRNLGASRAAISSTDYLSYGCLYQWGRGNDGHASITWTSSTTGIPVNGTTATLATADNSENALFILAFKYPFDWRSDNNDKRWQTKGDTNNNPCPTDFHVPTNAEINDEFIAYTILNSADAYTKGPGGGFKFVIAGYRYSSSSSFYGQGNKGYYWSSNSSGSDAKTRTFDSESSYGVDSYSRREGLSVRCIKD